MLLFRRIAVSTNNTFIALRLGRVPCTPSRSLGGLCLWRVLGTLSGLCLWRVLGTLSGLCLWRVLGTLSGLCLWRVEICHG